MALIGAQAAVARKNSSVSNLSITTGWISNIIKRLNTTYAAFIFIGQQPNSEFVAPTVERDPWGFILTGQDLVHGRESEWERLPLAFETNAPGIFAAGDVRQGAVRRVASAVGQGAIAVSVVHQYLRTV